MKKYFVVEKSKVIKALETEPLRAGMFFRIDQGGYKDCEVCAVGAVLRKHLSVNTITKFDKENNIGEIVTLCMYYFEDVTNLLKKKNYLGALSCYFEDQICVTDNNFDKPYLVTKKDRELLITFVKKNFPTRFRVELE